MIKPIDIATIQGSTGIFSLIVGLSGYGKTSSIRNFPKDKTAIICSEPQGLTSLVKFGWKGGKIICPTSPDQYLSAVEECINDAEVKHIVVDTISQYYDLLLKQYIENADKGVDKLGLDMYRVAGLHFQHMMRRLLDATYLGKDVVGLIHMKYRVESEGDKSKNIKEPAISDSLSQWLCRQASLVLRAEKVRAGKEPRYLLVSESTDGDCGKDIYGACNGVCDNDLWKLFCDIKDQKPKEPPAEAPTYAALLKLAQEYKIRKPEVDAWISRIKLDVSKAGPSEWKDAIDKFRAEHCPF